MSHFFRKKLKKSKKFGFWFLKFPVTIFKILDKKHDEKIRNTYHSRTFFYVPITNCLYGISIKTIFTILPHYALSSIFIPILKLFAFSKNLWSCTAQTGGLKESLDFTCVGAKYLSRTRTVEIISDTELVSESGVSILLTRSSYCSHDPCPQHHACPGINQVGIA